MVYNVFEAKFNVVLDKEVEICSLVLDILGFQEEEEEEEEEEWELIHMEKLCRILSHT